MDPLDSQLFVFSWVFFGVLVAMLMIPILFFKQDWLTAWNLFLVGSIMFTALSGVSSATALNYIPYSESTYLSFYIGTIVFYAAIFCVYHFFHWPRRFAGRHFLKWPTQSVSGLFILVVLLTLFSTLFVLAPNIPFVGQILTQFSIQAPVVAATLAFIAWYRNRANPLLLAVMVIALTLAMFFGIFSGSGRRYLINALIVPIVCCYWLSLRYRSNAVNIIALSCLLFVTVPVYIAYNAVRHAYMPTAVRFGMSNTERTLDVLRRLPSALSREVQFSAQTASSFMGQDSVETALVTIEMLNDGSNRLEVNPLFAVYSLVTNPIPRNLWPNKPQSLGYYLVHDLRVGENRRGNYGVNVVGQAYFDGGLLVHLLYALLFGSFLRIVDELLKRQPDNPYLLAFLSCSAAQFLAWPRGQVDIISMQIVSPLVFVLLIAYVGRLLVGTGYIAPPTGQVLNFPDRFSMSRMRQMQL